MESELAGGKDQDCRHTWVVPPPSGSREVTAVCRACSSERVMYNSLDRDPNAWTRGLWHEIRSPFHAGYGSLRSRRYYIDNG